MPGTGGIEMKDNGEVVLHQCRVGQSEEGVRVRRGSGSCQMADGAPPAALEGLPMLGAPQVFRKYLLNK